MPGCLPATAAPKSVYLSIYLSISIFLSICLSIHLSIFISFFLFFFLSFSLAAVLFYLSFCFCFSICLLCREETKQGSKQASKHELLTLGSSVLLGGALRPPQPPRTTKSALHLRHLRLPRNQYVDVNSPAQQISNQANMPPALVLFLFAVSLLTAPNCCDR